LEKIISFVIISSGNVGGEIKTLERIIHDDDDISSPFLSYPIQCATHIFTFSFRKNCLFIFSRTNETKNNKQHWRSCDV
jgi:hypothetical protein